MAKKITGYIKLQVAAGAANPSPPIGPALGQRGVNIMEFCKAFNAATEKMEKGTPLPTIITVYADRSFSFVTKQPPATYLIKKAMNIQVGLEGAGQDFGRQHQALAARRNRPGEDGRPQCERHRRRDEDHRRQRPRNGPSSGGGLRPWQS